jgi:C-terminal processing protease CtpA/Prc
MCKSALLLVAMCLASYGQTFDFESGTIAAWSGTGFSMDDKVVHGGKWAIRIERAPGSGEGISGITRSVPMDFTGQSLTLHAYLRTESVTGYVGLWMREDGDAGPLEFDNMQRRQLKGTTEWQEYTITLRVHPDARRLFFGVFVQDSGTTWVDDLRLLVDGKPLDEAPNAERPKTVLDIDHEFDAGSGVSVTQLTAAQVDHLSLLGKIWGFLKYHHPEVAGGKRHWDYDLFRILPAVLAAPDRAAVRAALVKWIAGVGPVGACEKCATLETVNAHLRPSLDWLRDEALLGTELSRTLQEIYRNRPANGKQFYVTKVGGVGNPTFDHELAYTGAKPGDSGYQILAVYRFWNMIEYWFPYRDVITGKWDDALRQSLPKIATAQADDVYQREMMALIARVEDTHANLWSSLAARPPVGACALAVTVRFAEGQAVVTESRRPELRRGDVITELDGAPVPKLVEQWSPYYAASNEPTRLRDIGRSMTRGGCGPMTLKVRRGAEELAVNAERTQAAGPGAGSNTHDRPGDTFQRLSPEVAYLKLSSVKQAEVPAYIDKAAGSKGLIIDIRNYPSEFMPFALGRLFVDEPTPFVRFTSGDLVNPGAFHWGLELILQPSEPRYKGKVIVLVDEVSQSQSEYTAMAFRASPRAKVLGSTTAGADGNVSAIPLPGGLRSMISGIGVFYPDKRPTQKIGILPDIEVKPTVAGLREGRDELVEAAIREILKD